MGVVNSLAVVGDVTGDITDALVRGVARFTGDLPIADVAELVFVRSPYAHARIVSIDVTAALQSPGVLAVLTARDMPQLRLHEIHIIPELLAPLALTADVARFVGDPVAVVVATTRGAAIDGAELVDVTYEPLTPVVTARDAVRDGATVLVPAHGSNVALAWDLDETDDSFAESQAPTVTVRGEIELPRLSTAPMEGHAIVVAPTESGGLHIYVSTQWPHGTRVQMARSFGLSLDQVRAQVPAVGGGFGGKSLGGIREHIATAAAARRLNRPVRYVEQRNDNLQSMQGRGVHISYEADATSDGRVVHLRVEDLCDCGAYPSTGAVEPGKTMMMSTGPYRIGHITFHARSVMTNLPPTGAYRGPGRAEASMVLEQVMDRVARARSRSAHRALPQLHGARRATEEVDHRRALRRSRLHRALTARAQASSNYDHWRDVQRARRASGDPNVVGIGVSSVFDSSAWFDRTDQANVRLTADGDALVELSSSSAGQHHDGAIARIVGDELCLPLARVRLIEGDTVLGSGGGSSGSRTIQIGGHAARAAALVMRQRLIERAADMLEAAVDDVVLDDGQAFVRGVPRSRVSYAELARAMPRRPGRLLPVRTERGDLSRGGEHRGRRSRHRVGSRALAATAHRHRLRHRARPARGARAGCRRERARHRAGAVRTRELRRRRQPAHREPRRVPDAVGGRPAGGRRRVLSPAVEPQSARRQGRGRSRDGRRARGRLRRGARRVATVRSHGTTDAL